MPGPCLTPSDIWARAITGTQPSRQRTDLLRQLATKPAQVNVVSNARCLAEGTDVPSLDAVAFVDPRYSQVDIIQAVGRAIRRHPAKKTGKIIIPVPVSSTSAHNEIDRTEFHAVYKILRALRWQDERLAEQLDDEQAKSAAGGRATLPSCVTIDTSLMPADLVPRFLDQLRPIVLEETAESWESWLRYLRDWVAENGAEALTRRLSGMPRNLRRWASKQRALGKRGRLTAGRRAILEAVAGWTWDADDSAWIQCYRATEEFHADHGRLPSNRGDLHDGLKVGSWLMKQRAAARDGLLGEERLNLLSKLPEFSSNQRDDKFWRAHAAYLAWSTTKSEVDLIRGPRTGESVQGVDLVQWVDNMRGRRRAKTAKGTDIPQWQLDALAKLPGWAWASVDAQRRADEFNLKVETVREYCQHHDVTARDITVRKVWLDKPIGRWITLGAATGPKCPRSVAVRWSHCRNGAGKRTPTTGRRVWRPWPTSGDVAATSPRPLRRRANRARRNWAYGSVTTRIAL